MFRLFIATFCCLLLSAFALGQCPEKAENSVPVQYAPQCVKEPILVQSVSENKPVVCKIQPYFLEPPDIITIEAIHLVPKAATELQKADMPPSPMAAPAMIPLPPVSQPVMAVPAAFSPPGMDPQPIVGNHTIGPDGYITLGSHGRVYVNGLTVDECRDAIEFHLSRHFEKPQVAVTIYSYNSKRYYVIPQTATGEEIIMAFPCTGAETVLDAIGNLGGFPTNSSIRAWVERPAVNSSKPVIMPVDWAGLVYGKLDTNYDLLPGDRVCVRENPLFILSENLRGLYHFARDFYRIQERIANGERVVAPTIR